MEVFRTFTAVAAPYYFPDVDTDKIIPHRFLRKPLSAGYRNFLFYNERYTPEGAAKPFILHDAPYDKAGILVAGSNFGCGSLSLPTINCSIARSRFSRRSRQLVGLHEETPRADDGPFASALRPLASGRLARSLRL